MQDSVNRIDNIIKRLKEINQTAWCITDHNTCSGVTDAYKKSKKAGIKLIPGAELYLTTDVAIQQKDLAHITFWAKTNEGLENLYKLTTAAHGDRGKSPKNYYYKSRVDLELIRKFSKGLMCGSACLGGFVNKDNGEYTLQELLKVFHEDLFLELHTYQCEEQYEYNKKLIGLSQKYNIPLVAATDAHFTWKHDADLRKYFKNTSKEQDESENVDDSLYLQSEDEVREYLKYLPKKIVEQSIVNTQIISDRSNVEIVFGQKHYPHFPCENPLKEVTRLANIGWKAKVKGTGVDEDLYRKRVKYEIDVLDKQDYCSYFLITADYLDFAVNNNIPIGPGRGSVVGCKIAELMGITSLDAIKYNLTFERFAHNERIAPPDIDCDISKKHRGEVIDYIRSKYGEVYQCRTFQIIGALGAIRRAGSALGWTQEDINALTKSISKYESEDDEEDMSTYEQKIWVLDHIKNESNAELIELAKRFVGIIFGYGKHASCVIIVDGDITKFCSIERQTDSKTHEPCYIAACSFPLLEEQGLMKADVLGLKTLDCIAETIELVGEPIDINNMPLDDQKTSQMLCKGGTSGCFQIESPGMTNLVKQIQPKGFEDLIPLVALYRPGPLNAIVEETGYTMVETYVKVRNHRQLQIWLCGNINQSEDKWPRWKENGGDLLKEDVIAPAYLHPKLEPILQPTYSIILYQEQLLEIAKELCGYSLGEADVIRRIVGKKKIDEMKPAVEQMIERGIANGISRDVMEKITKQIVEFALYSFNKGHSAAYGYIAYQTAYLKAHYPLQFMCATINSEDNNQKNILPYINECRSLNIGILPPDLIKGNRQWIIEGGSLRIGLAYIKGVGKNLCLDNIDTFADVVACNPKDVTEALIKAGALDYLGQSRQALLDQLEPLQELLKRQQQCQNKIQENQLALANAADDKSIKKYSRQLKLWKDKLKECQSKTLETTSESFDEVKGEYEVLGFSFKGLPKVILGKLTRIYSKLDKNKNEMAWFTFDTDYGEIRSTVFHDTWRKIKTTVKQGESYVFVNDPKGILQEIKIGDKTWDFRRKWKGK